MKTFKIKLFVALGSTLGNILPLIAQQQVIIENQVPNSLVVVSMDDIGNEIVKVMQTSQLPHVHDPQIPRFILTDREGNFALGIGGYVRTVTSYDFDGLVDNVDFISGNGKLTVQGENFVLTRCASTLSRAKNKLYDDLSEINFDGIKYRKDVCLN